ncbi:MAG: ATP phosphoribosyltransferase regulatory subunit [Clostridia bacterium]|nr:ATP phosphoribosyltransferase regulatory subunit [Clostridia bacterium]
MQKNNKITPLGFRDYLFEESEALNEINSRLMRLFSHRGFHQVVTPTLEFLDVFALDGEQMPVEKMYKLCDNRGRLLVLRPDITMPIARLAATRLKDEQLPLRLCYTESVYNSNYSLHGHRDEITQSGVELLGAQGKRADLEILVLAAQSLSRCGANDFKIEIGHAGVFKSLIGELDEDEQTIETIRSLIETKCYAALDDVLLGLKNQKVAKILKRLPHLFGGEDVLSEAKELCGDICGDALSYLGDIFSSLKELGLKDNIYLDLGLVHSNTYYTGVLFRGYIAGSGITVLSGGRYDELLSKFGVNMAAIGFAVQNDAMAEILLQSGQISKTTAPDMLVFAEKGYELKALNYCDSLANQGKTVESSVFDTFEESVEYAKKRGIKRIVTVAEQTSNLEI